MRRGTDCHSTTQILRTSISSHLRMRRMCEGCCKRFFPSSRAVRSSTRTTAGLQTRQTGTTASTMHLVLNSSLGVLCGHSGHGFKILPIVGGFVVELLQGTSHINANWRWKESSEFRETSLRRGDTTTRELEGIPCAIL